MLNPNGALVINGLQDAELVKILEVKMHHENSLTFNPQQMQIGVVAKPHQPGQPMPAVRPGMPQQPHPQQQVQVYNNINLAWTNEQGLEAVQEIVHFLLRKEEKEKAVGQ